MVFAPKRGVIMQLTEKELIEAVTEWCARRGVTVTKDTPITFTAYTQGVTYRSNAGTRFTSIIDNVTMPPKDGPYR